MTEEATSILNTTSSVENQTEPQYNEYVHNSIVFVLNFKFIYIFFLYSPADGPILNPGKDFEQQHAGHESQHGTMALILLAALFGFQFLILYWKSKHYRSFQAVTLVGLW